MERIGIFGGSFNPPHIGHIQAAQMAVQALKLDRLLMIPVHTAPHKEVQDAPDAAHRLAMLRIALAGAASIEISDLEISRGGTSYTYETVETLRTMYPDAEFFLLMGSDMFQSLQTWKYPERILANATLSVFCRGDKDEREKNRAQKEILEAKGHRVILLDNPVLEISSTQLRRMLAFQCADPFLPAGVGDYIRKNGLYQTAADWKNLPMEQLEPIVISLLKPSRVKHVQGCRDTCVELARRWGVDETDAGRAGILHDITKALDGPLQLTLCSEYDKILSAFSRKYPKTLHALTGSLVAQRIFGENAAVVSAIESHTTGKAAMNTLEKILYVADYMEPNRDFPGVERLRELAFTDLDEALKLGLMMTLDHLARLGDEVSPASKEALEYLNVKI